MNWGKNKALWVINKAKFMEKDSIEDANGSKHSPSWDKVNKDLQNFTQNWEITLKNSVYTSADQEVTKNSLKKKRIIYLIERT